MPKYNEIMEKINVTPEMRERVLSNVRKAREDTAKTNRNPGLWIKRMMPVAAAACLVLIIGTVFYQNRYKGEENPVDTSNYSMEECESLDALKESVGFDVEEMKGIPFDVDHVSYTNVFGIARVEYAGKDGEVLTFSKGQGEESDVSGDNNEYSDASTVELNGTSVTMKGNGNSVNLATWSKDGYSYSISVSPGISEDEMEEMIVQ